MPKTKAPREFRSTGYEIFVGLVSTLTLVNLALSYVFRDQPDLQTVLLAADIGVSVIFLTDFTYRFVKAPSKREYFLKQYGWADLLSGIPLNEFKIFRLLRIVRVVQFLRAVGFRYIRASLRRVRAENTLLSLIFVGIVVMEFGSLQILAVEREAPDPNIQSASDALWYTIVTISTVGYGDHYPTTDTGRVIGVLLIIVGVGLFAAFTGYLADKFLSPSKGSDDGGDGEGPGDASGAEAPDAAPRGREVGAEEVAAVLRDARAMEQVRALLERPDTTVDDVARLVEASRRT